MLSKEYRILIVEDGKTNQKVLWETLNKDYTLQIIETGKSALAIVTDFRPHLILLDIILPDITGFDVLKILKSSSETRSTPVLIITGLDSDTDEEKGLLMGAVDYIRKPFSPTILKARVKNHIQIVRQIETIEKMGYIDALTNLPNRRKFNYRLEYEWNRAIRKETNIGIMLMDLDSFKNYNDIYGHTQGDLLLQEVGKVLKKALKRSTDLPCRWGGEEFAILLPETNLQNLLLIAEKIRANIEKIRIPTMNEKQSTQITASIGAILVPPRQSDIAVDFMDKADQLLYQAKKLGKNQVQYKHYYSNLDTVTLKIAQGE